MPTDWRKVVEMLYEDAGRSEIMEDSFIKEVIRKYGSQCETCLEDIEDGENS